MFKISSIVLLLCLLLPCTSLFSKEDPYNEADTPCSLILSIGYPFLYLHLIWKYCLCFLFLAYPLEEIFFVTGLLDSCFTNSKSDLDEMWYKGDG